MTLYLLFLLVPPPDRESPDDEVFVGVYSTLEKAQAAVPNAEWARARVVAPASWYGFVYRRNAQGFIRGEKLSYVIREHQLDAEYES